MCGLCSRVVFVGGRGGFGVVVTPTHSHHSGGKGKLCRCFYSATLHNLLRHTTIPPPPCKHPEGRWVVVVGRRWRGVLSMWTVCPHPPRQHNTQHGTSPPPPAASAEPRRGARPARRAGGSTAADCEVGGAQFSRDTNANSWQLFCATVKVVESCGKFSSETN